MTDDNGSNRAYPAGDEGSKSGETGLGDGFGLVFDLVD